MSPSKLHKLTKTPSQNQLKKPSLRLRLLPLHLHIYGRPTNGRAPCLDRHIEVAAALAPALDVVLVAEIGVATACDAAVCEVTAREEREEAGVVRYFVIVDELMSSAVRRRRRKRVEREVGGGMDGEWESKVEGRGE